MNACAVVLEKCQLLSLAFGRSNISTEPKALGIVLLVAPSDVGASVISRVSALYWPCGDAIRP